MHGGILLTGEIGVPVVIKQLRAMAAGLAAAAGVRLVQNGVVQDQISSNGVVHPAIWRWDFSALEMKLPGKKSLAFSFAINQMQLELAAGDPAGLMMAAWQKSMAQLWDWVANELAERAKEPTLTSEM